MTGLVERGPGPRWVLPAEDDLIRAIGRAVYGFALFERSVERAREALGGLLKSRRDRLLRVRLPDPDSDARRTGLIGGAACAWCAEDILRLARDIEAAAVETNRLLRKRL